MRIPLRYLLIACFFWLPTQSGLRAQTDENVDPIQQALQNRLAKNPDDANAWRLIGRINLEQEEFVAAVAACSRAVELAPESASSHFDLARSLLANGDQEQAVEHFAEVIALAPESDYGVQAISYIEESGNDSNLVPPRADLDPSRFSGTPFDTSDATRRWAAALDLGVAYNSNVELAPISRDPATQGPASAQVFLAPQFETRLWTGPVWDSGVLFNGYFAFNEAHVREFDLQDYQPGAFIERVLTIGSSERIWRTQYDFSLNEFQGETFGRRHAITSSLSRDREYSSSRVYWTIDYSDFADDGLLPSQSSLDGWTNTLGASHSIFEALPIADSIRSGIDFQYADLVGSDYSYRGIFAYLESESCLPLNCWLELQLGGGYRHYPDFLGNPSRNETLWRASAELSRDLTPWCRVIAFSTYDRFASQNDLFDAQRFYSGIMTSLRW